MMKWLNIVWPKEAFKNFYAYSLTAGLMYCMIAENALKDVSIAILMLIVKHYFDNNTGDGKKDEAIKNMSNSIPDAPKSSNNEKPSN